MDLLLIRDLGIALGLGLLIGLQREHAGSGMAGIRTFALISLFGGLVGLLDSGWVLAAGVIAIAALFWVANRASMDGGEYDVGLTTEIAALVTYLIGVLVMQGLIVPAVVTAGLVAVLLQWKGPLHRFVDRIGGDDLKAVIQLVIIGMVILPILPNETYGPYDVLNPFKIWLMVVLIVGISMAAWIVQRLLGAKVGTLLAGILGGLISSTAMTVSYARRSRSSPGESQAAALVVMIASTVVFARVLIEVAIVTPSLLGRVAAPLGVMMAFMAVICAANFVLSRSALAAPDEEQPPSDLKAAVIFGLLYAGVLFAVAAAKTHFGDAALYVVATLSGLTDMDAITLSVAQLMKAGTVEVTTGWRLILVGALANLVFKGAIVAALGSRALLVRVAILFGISLAGGAVILVVWPG